MRRGALVDRVVRRRLECRARTNVEWFRRLIARRDSGDVVRVCKHVAGVGVKPGIGRWLHGGVHETIDPPVWRKRGLQPGCRSRSIAAALRAGKLGRDSVEVA